MMTIEISDLTDARLKKIAKPLLDTYDTVIARLLDEFDAHRAAQPKKPGEAIKVEGNIMHFDPKNPPPLRFTTLTRVVLNGEEFPKSDTYWNRLMDRMILEAGQAGHDAEEVYKILFVNRTLGEKTDNGFTFLPEVGLSVQGQDSNAAFRQAFQLAEKLGSSLAVWFHWQGNEKAAYPNQRAACEL